MSSPHPDYQSFKSDSDNEEVELAEQANQAAGHAKKKPHISSQFICHEILLLSSAWIQ
jgi:hypothetical protein